MHYDRELAQRMGFEGNFAQGMFTAGLMSVIVAERHTPDAVLGFGVKFVSPLFCGGITDIHRDGHRDHAGNHAHPRNPRRRTGVAHRPRLPAPPDLTRHAFPHR